MTGDGREPTDGGGTQRISATYRVYRKDYPWALLFDMDREAWVWVSTAKTPTIGGEFVDIRPGNVIDATLTERSEDDVRWEVESVALVDDTRLWDVVAEGYVPDVADRAWERREPTDYGPEGRVTVTADDGSTLAVFDAMASETDQFDGRTLWEAYRDQDFLPEPWFTDGEILGFRARQVVFLNLVDRPYDLLASFPPDSDEFDRFAASLESEVVEGGERVTERMRVYSDPSEQPVRLQTFDDAAGSVRAVPAETVDTAGLFDGVECGNVVELTATTARDERGYRRVFDLDVVRDDRIWVAAPEGPAPELLRSNFDESGGQGGEFTVVDDSETVRAEFALCRNEEFYHRSWVPFQHGHFTFEGEFDGSAVDHIGSARAAALVDFVDCEFMAIAAFDRVADLEQFQDAVANAERASEASTTGGGGSDETDFEYDWQESTGITFGDVGGMESVKAELERDVIRPLTVDRERAEAFGIPLQNVLLYGPPGTGKTYLANALANEAGVPFVTLSGGDVVSKWVNASAGRVNRLFTEAEAMANRAGGALVFLDELDAVLSARSGTQHGEDRKVVNEFLSHLQDSAEAGVVFVGATNKREDLDEAAIRSGRIDKEVHVGLPDEDARRAILAAQLQDRPTDVDDQTLDEVAASTDGFTAAELAELVNDAARLALFGRDDDAIADQDLRDAVDEWVDEAETDNPDPVDGDSYHV